MKMKSAYFYMYLLQIKLTRSPSWLLNLEEYSFLCIKTKHKVYKRGHINTHSNISLDAFHDIRQHIRLEQSEMQCSESTKHAKAVGFKETI